DGWGLAAPGPGNAISQSKTVNMNKFKASYPNGQIQASGEAVGLPRGEDGNTETGHLNLGAGRIVYQNLERINMSIADGTFFKNDILIKAVRYAKNNNSKLHLMGLVGAGGVHSNLEHLFSLLRLASQEKFNNLFIHIFTDGRDSPPTSAKTYVSKISSEIKKENVGSIASIMGRYWAMDRDQRWDRTSKAYFALTKGEGNLVSSVEVAIEDSYSKGKTDEFIEPSLVTNKNGKPLALIENNDSVIFYNFRIDRPRQLSKAFVFSDFSKANITYDFEPYKIKYQKTHIKESLQKPKPKDPFPRGENIKSLYFVTMTEYSMQLSKEGATPAFPPEVIDNPIGSVISSKGLRQLRITESEKERFVTYYFNGLRDKAFPLEERIIVPSSSVSTYDQKPEMSSEKITNSIISKLSTMDYKFAVVNYPNPDMVGHTGNIGPTVKAIEFVDECIGKLANCVIAYDGAILITSDHGNAEEMINLSTGEIDTEHSSNPVPVIIIGKPYLGKPQKLIKGILADIAPTILGLLNIIPPAN
ncbi:MAG: 2,3-bisphosphoglycerate-independent phosphoglycerate mutase, partial [Thermodesulfovibrionia bacterium]|nr:2,3-bisphosphoglycerate-independent phosphoglycerate mutase [Thermodesulfovibrionia bacterium]